PEERTGRRCARSLTVPRRKNRGVARDRRNPSSREEVGTQGVGGVGIGRQRRTFGRHSSCSGVGQSSSPHRSGRTAWALKRRTERRRSPGTKRGCRRENRELCFRTRESDEGLV